MASMPRYPTTPISGSAAVGFPSSSPVSDSFPSSTPGPVRHVRTRPKKPTSSYGLFFSDEEDTTDEDGDVMITEGATATPTAARSSSTRPPSTSPRKRQVVSKSAYSTPARQSMGPSVKALTIERKPKPDASDLYGRSGHSRRSPAKEVRLPPPQESSSRGKSHRQTPYRVNGSPLKGQPQSRFDDSSSPGDAHVGNGASRIPVRPPKYTMKGAVGSAEPVTPPNKIKGALTAPPQTAPAKPTSTIWGIGDWFKNKLTQSVTKSSLSGPAELVEDTDSNIGKVVQIDDSSSSSSGRLTEQIEEGEKEGRQDYRVPGGFERASSQPPQEPEKKPYVNPFLKEEVWQNKPIAGPTNYGSLGTLLTPKRNERRRTPAFKKRDTSQAVRKSRKRATLATGDRADSQVSVSTPPEGGNKRRRLNFIPKDMDEESKKKMLTARLAELDEEDREANVLAQERNYERRWIRSMLLGKNLDEIEDEEEEKSEVGQLEAEKEQLLLEAPPKSPEPVSAEASQTSTTPAARPTSFLFGGASFKAPVSPAPLFEQPAPSANAINNISASPDNATKVPFSTTENNKENSPTPTSPKPPAAPTLSHAQLPAPVNNGALLPPPFSQPPQMFPTKGGSALGLGDAAQKARTKAEKFKPHISSSLRASTSVPASPPPKNNLGKPQFLHPGSALQKHKMHAPPVPAATSPASTMQSTLDPKLKKMVDMVSIFPSVVHVVGSSGSGVDEWDWKMMQMPMPNEEDLTKMYPFQMEGIELGSGTLEREMVEKMWVAPGEEEMRGVVNMFVEKWRPVVF